MQNTAERLPTIQRPEIDQELRVITDTTTWLAETLHGSMRTSFEYTHDGQELRGEDGGSITDIFDDAIKEAKAMVEWNPSLLFELRRRLIERDELSDMDKMVSGELPNTMVVISDFPPELQNAKEDVGGYNVNRQQTMMRIISLGENGKISVTSQSLDGSNRKALEAIYAGMGVQAKEGELLSQRIHCDMSPDRQQKLADSLTRVYDDSLVEQKGGEWHAGISQQPDRNMINTYEFISSQHDLIDWFAKEKLADPVGAEKLRFKLAATAKARYEQFLRSQKSADFTPGEYSNDSIVNSRTIGTAHRNANPENLMNELERNEIRAAMRGEVFSGCGSSIGAEKSSDGTSTSEGQLEKLGFGNRSKSSADEDCEFISKECPMPGCHAKNVKTRVTKTHIYGSCGCSKRK